MLFPSITFRTNHHILLWKYRLSIYGDVSNVWPYFFFSLRAFSDCIRLPGLGSSGMRVSTLKCGLSVAAHEKQMLYSLMAPLLPPSRVHRTFLSIIRSLKRLSGEQSLSSKECRSYHEEFQDGISDSLILTVRVSWIDQLRVLSFATQ